MVAGPAQQVMFWERKVVVFIVQKTFSISSPHCPLKYMYYTLNLICAMFIISVLYFCTEVLEHFRKVYFKFVWSWKENFLSVILLMCSRSYWAVIEFDAV